jgi:hypothetical protein
MILEVRIVKELRAHFAEVRILKGLAFQAAVPTNAAVQGWSESSRLRG